MPVMIPTSTCRPLFLILQLIIPSLLCILSVRGLLHTRVAHSALGGPSPHLQDNWRCVVSLLLLSLPHYKHSRRVRCCVIRAPHSQYEPLLCTYTSLCFVLR